ncbi:type I secretion system permease/ATPase [Aureimonas phyllosphaerae]|uniref:PrtD family type I secretion system ABC transporter n=1 Tax=Aureimonas phyllosphaerae TaxID=1166078 RepID=A0A7W6BTZ5_9HYPH|nr:type I secretion system permease/ATPase [Aureimonas phyllosphaerae]MBB3934585.1 PrtD family type I secretion system ABC transporter [Aureimonas phyllosphaerae]MBB3958199.1 PrtD family type I secretion system ABC transporter [Aureimonas phyllosphaerae]SFE93417.1 ATP-binding cassette, subfamily C/ATP-binding cassette, subfamily C, exporter for protease/lipase/ATP-binding cassette, subfamily C, EexD [Aureimonas phyllosphaerae]
MQPNVNLAPEMRDALRAGAKPMAFAALFSFGSNLLFLAMPLYMTQVYSRVITSHSEATLIYLSIAVIMAFVVMIALEELRGRILIGIGSMIDRKMAPRLLDAVVNAGLRAGRPARASALRDLDTFRQGIAGNVTNTILDTPWAPIFLIVITMIDWRLGMAATVGAILLFGLALLNEYVTKPALKEANIAGQRSYAATDSGLRNAEVIYAMGMLPGLTNRWNRDRLAMLASQEEASERGGSVQAAIRFLNNFLQVSMLAGGALLVIEGLAGPGIMFAAVMLVSKALAPVQRAVGSWSTIVNTRQSFERLNALLLEFPAAERGMELPRPAGKLSVEGCFYAFPGTNKALLKNLNFALEPGDCLGLIGPSGAGKSSLARLLIGVQRPTSGSVRLDGAEMHSWGRDHIGRHIGYLPQDVELFSGTVRENIARFAPQPDDAAVLAAARMAGCHDLILRLPDGYDTELGEGGAMLSVGQRQRVALARAVYGNPSFVVLDEPNASLDSDGEQALLAAIVALRRIGSTVVVISHRMSALNYSNKILLLRDGMVERFGPRDEVLARVVAPAPAPATQQPQPQPAVAAAPEPKAIPASS